MTDPSETLSITGETRQEEILALAIRAARHRRRERRAWQAGAGIALGVLVVTYVFRTPSPKPEQYALTRIEVPHSNAPQASRVVITTIATERGITERLTLSAHRPRWQRIGDDELLQSLAQAGQHAGLINVNGQTVLLSR